MASVLIRGVARSSHYRSIALQKYYSANPIQQPSNDGASKPPADKPPVNKAKDEHSADKSEGPVGMAGQKLAELKTKIEESQRRVEQTGENLRAMPENLRGYALDRFISYIKNYDKVLEKKFPGAMKVYRVFMDGVKFFGRDMMHFVKIRSRMVIKGHSMASMTRRELEIYYQMPNDMRKVGPIILISAIPFAHYLTMPIAYMYPRQCLTSHFWTLQQRSEFAVMNIRDRLTHNRPVFRNLQNKLETLKNDRHYEQWKVILGKLGSGVHPTVDEIISVKDLFAEPPYKTGSLSYTHIKHLAGMHGVKAIFTKKSKLTYRAMCLHHIDLAINREGGPRNLPVENLRDSCFMRGLNASNISNDELIKFLDDWITVSKHITPDNFSLYLHLPVFLTYNHPNNWKLIYHER